MKKVLVLIVVILAFALALAVSVPDEASFREHLVEVDHGDGDASLLDRAGNSLTRAQAKLTSDYRHHVLWATVEATRGTEHERWLGALGMWIQLPSSDEG